MSKDWDIAEAGIIQTQHRTGLSSFPKYFIIQNQKEDHSSSCSSSDRSQARPASSPWELPKTFCLHTFCNKVKCLANTLQATTVETFHTDPLSSLVSRLAHLVIPCTGDLPDSWLLLLLFLKISNSSKIAFWSWCDHNMLIKMRSDHKFILWHNDLLCPESLV